MHVLMNLNFKISLNLPEAGVGIVEGILALAVQVRLAPGELPRVPLRAGCVHPLAALAAVLHQEPPGHSRPRQDGHSVMTGISLDT